MTPREIAEQNCILLGTVGSSAHGLNVPGQDDHDEMGICLEPATHVIGLQKFEQDVFRTQPEGHRSGPGDTDRVIYSLRKWSKLSLQGNPSVLVLLFVEPDESHEIGQELQANYEWFASREAGKRFLGYLTSQKLRLLGERGQKNVKRPELEEMYGFDTKYAMHIIRLGTQGIEFLETGKLTLPMPEKIRDYIYSIRIGKVDFQEIVEYTEDLEFRLNELIDGASPLPPYPNYDAVNNFMIEAYQYWWNV